MIRASKTAPIPTTTAIAMSRNRDDDRPTPSPAPDGGDAIDDSGAHSFLLRLWKELRVNAEEKPIWRGTVSDLRGRQLGSFSSAAELVGIIGDMSGINVQLRVSCFEPGREPALGDPPPSAT